MTAPGGRHFELAAADTVTGLLAASEFVRGDRVANRFRIERLLGMGGMGLVYLAHDEQLGVEVALKLLRPELAARPDSFNRFRQELLLARQVSSPHVVRIHDLVQHGEVWLLSMDFVPGRSLQQILDEELVLPPARAIDITRQIALGLAAAHQRGVIHRDLKPANILVTETGEALITDFGVARSAGASGLTLSGTIVGTPEYLSPEQAKAEPTDGRSDLYALGLVLHEMLTGSVPFSGGTPAEMLAQRIVRSPPPVDTVKPGLPALAVGLCSGLLDVRPARRFQDATSVVRVIEQGRVVRRSGGRRAWPVAALVLLIAVAAVWIWTTNVATQPDAGLPVAASLDPEFAVIASGPVSAAAQSWSRGLEIEIAARMIRAGMPVAEPERVGRALAELGIDREREPALRERVAATLGASRLFLIVEGPAPGMFSLQLSDPSESEPIWERTLPTDANSAVDAAFWSAVASQVDADLARDSIAAAQLELLAAAAQVPGPDSRVSIPPADASPRVWWSVMESLARVGRNEDGARVAREGIRTFASAKHADALRTLAMAHWLTGDPASALDLLERAKTPRFDVGGRLLHARLLLDTGSYDAAAKELIQIVAIDERNAEAWFELGRTRLMQGEAKLALDEALTRAAVAANRLSDRRMLADIANAMGIGYRQLGQLDAAAEQFERAGQLRAALGDVRGAGVSLRNLAAVRSIQGRFDEAARLLDDARAKLTPLGDAGALADLQNDVGLLAEERGDFRAALEAYREALAFLQVDGDPALIAESQLNVGFSYFQLGEFDNAQAFLNQAAAGYDAIDDQSGAIRAQQAVGLLQVARGAFAAGRDLLQQSLDRAETLQMHEEQSAALAALAELDRMEGRYAQSLDSARRAAQMFAERGDLRGKTEMALVESATLLEIGDTDGAEAALAAESAADTGNIEQRAKFLQRKAEIAMNRGRAAEARELSIEALSTASKSGVADVETTARLLRARIEADGRGAAAAQRFLGEAGGKLSHFPSVPLRLDWLEAKLQIDADASSLAEARALIARLTAYGREWRIEYLGRSVAPDAEAAREAATRAGAAVARIKENVPVALLTVFEATVEQTKRMQPETEMMP